MRDAVPTTAYKVSGRGHSLHRSPVGVSGQSYIAMFLRWRQKQFLAVALGDNGCHLLAHIAGPGLLPDIVQLHGCAAGDTDGAVAADNPALRYAF